MKKLKAITEPALKMSRTLYQVDTDTPNNEYCSQHDQALSQTSTESKFRRSSHVFVWVRQPTVCTHLIIQWKLQDCLFQSTVIHAGYKISDCKRETKHATICYSLALLTLTSCILRLVPLCSYLPPRMQLPVAIYS